MFTSNVRELMDKKNITVRELVGQTGMSSRTIQRAVSDETIHKCELGDSGQDRLSPGREDQAAL